MYPLPQWQRLRENIRLQMDETTRNFENTIFLDLQSMYCLVCTLYHDDDNMFTFHLTGKQQNVLNNDDLDQLQLSVLAYAMTMMEYIFTPFGVVHGSEKQGGTHEGTYSGMIAICLYL